MKTPKSQRLTTCSTKVYRLSLYCRIIWINSSTMGWVICRLRRCHCNVAVASKFVFPEALLFYFSSFWPHSWPEAWSSLLAARPNFWSSLQVLIIGQLLCHRSNRPHSRPETWSSLLAAKPHSWSSFQVLIIGLLVQFILIDWHS